MDWKVLHSRFRRLGDITGCSKTSSYSMNIGIDQDGTIVVELGCYDIADWPRHMYLGHFNTMEEAYIATEDKIIEAENIVMQEEKENKPTAEFVSVLGL